MNQDIDSFICKKCGKTVINSPIGTKQRNHCPLCLWSVHVDLKPGDRASSCFGLMEPIGITFKKEKANKYKPVSKGEIACVHRCGKCSKIRTNRFAGDDDADKILELIDYNMDDDLMGQLKSLDMCLCKGTDKQEIETQLFGKG